MVRGDQADDAAHREFLNVLLLEVRMTRLGVAATAILITSAIVVSALRARPVITDTDFAVSQVYVELASRGQLLLGPYSRFGWHHPGPLFFYVTAPFYVLAGHEAAVMYAVALAINLASLVTIGWVISRESPGPLASTVVIGLLLLSWRAEPFLASPWNAHVAILPAIAALVIAAAVMSGRLQLLIPLVVFASFAIQTHVGFAPTVSIIALIAVVAGVMAWRAAGLSPWRPLTLAFAVLLFLSVPVIIEAATSAGGNILELWRFFIEEPQPSSSIRDVLAFSGYGLTSIIRPSFQLSWSERVEVGDPTLSVLGVLLTIALLIATVWRNVTEDRRFETSLAIVALAATAIGVWGMTQIRGFVLDYDLMRLAGVGTLDYSIIATIALWPLANRIHGLRPAAVLRIVIIGAALVIGLRHLDSLTDFERRQNRYRILEAYRVVRDYLTRNGVKRPMLQVGPGRWGESAGVLARLVGDGTSVAVPSNLWFTPYFAPNGTEDAVVVLADPALHNQLLSEPDNVVLLQAPPLFVVARRIVPAR